MTVQTTGPFRHYPWPLEQVRAVARYLRLLRVRIKGPKKFKYGGQVSLAGGADIRAPHFVEFGSRVSIGKNFTCEVDLRVGDDVLISSNVACIGRDHPFDNPSVSVYSADRLDNSFIKIGTDVLIGFGTIVIGSVQIGDGCIVGAGSVVVNDLPPYTVCVGVPAKPLRARYS